MAAYAALVSLKHIIDQITDHPSPPISLDKQQLGPLTEKITFLQGFLEGYNSPFEYSDDADPLETRIANATHAAEDVIENFIVNNIQLAATTPDDDDDLHYDVDIADDERTNFYQDVQEVIEEMDLMMEMSTEKAAAKPQLQRNFSAHAALRSTSSEMVGFDDVLLQLLERLTGGNLNRQIIPIVGMGGIGKTTLAIKEHFDISLWATISQDCGIGKTLTEILSQTRVDFSSKSERELGEQLHKYLAGRRYVIIMDDMWSIEVWDQMKFFFPDYKNGSRILVTSRLSNLAANLTDPNSLLDGICSPKLYLKKKVFLLTLRKLERKLWESVMDFLCQLLLLAVLWQNLNTPEHWEHIDENLSSIVNLESGEYCLRILKTSYNHLPTHLKPCFLYMGVFEEDCSIRVSELIKL